MSITNFLAYLNSLSILVFPKISRFEMIVIGFMNGDIVTVCGTKYLSLGIHFAYNKKSKAEKNILKAIY